MNKCLVVVDMQNDFIDGSLGSKEAVAIVDNVVKKIHGFNERIFVTLDTHECNYLDTYEGKKLPVPHCIKMTNGWLVNERVLDALSDKNYKMIEKKAFGSLDLVDNIHHYYENRGMCNEIELIGLCTDICVVSNALLLKANFPDIKITVDASCCAGVTPKSHQEALNVMKCCHIDVIGE